MTTYSIRIKRLENEIEQIKNGELKGYSMLTKGVEKIKIIAPDEAAILNRDIAILNLKYYENADKYKVGSNDLTDKDKEEYRKKASALLESIQNKSKEARFYFEQFVDYAERNNMNSFLDINNEFRIGNTVAVKGTRVYYSD